MTLKEWLPEALIINRNESKCGACGKGADPDAKTHSETRGWGPVSEGCGVRWRFVTSEYVGAGVKEAACSMRPDLEWRDRWPSREGNAA